MDADNLISRYAVIQARRNREYEKDMKIKQAMIDSVQTSKHHFVTYIDKVGTYKFTDLFVQLHANHHADLDDFRKCIHCITDVDVKHKIQTEFDQQYQMFMKQFYLNFICRMNARDIATAIEHLNVHSHVLENLDNMMI